MSFSFLPFFLFNSNRCRTMVATTSPPSPHAHAGTDRTDPVASATYRPRRLNVRHLLSSPARRHRNRHYPDCRSPNSCSRTHPRTKYSDKFFLFFPSHLNLTGQWRPHHCRHLHLPHPHVGNPAHTPYCRNRSLPLQRPRHRPNHGRFSRRYLNCHHPNCHRCHPSHRAPTVTAPTATATPIPAPPPHPLPTQPPLYPHPH